MAIPRFLILIACSIGAAQLSCAATILASVFSGSPTDCPTSFSKPTGDAAPTDIPQDGYAFNISTGPLGCPPSFPTSGLPDARLSGFRLLNLLMGDAFDKSLTPSQSDIPPTLRNAFVQPDLPEHVVLPFRSISQWLTNPAPKGKPKIPFPIARLPFDQRIGWRDADGYPTKWNYGNWIW
ncbi:hypothetical protein K443DRAFT_124592 [Laccaria amethystina LaAM-08-1]|uniref:Uncharacterized protein n=1 Tax=Laccaria amethystina LaAM-08-1 TaxID=1095629 RepID=A0A0C9WKA2_9AGAR|nr:hypothetical protein K443DRAFT_124592 [Laccaria amethystina LaAM-08-1]